MSTGCVGKVALNKKACRFFRANKGCVTRTHRTMLTTSEIVPVTKIFIRFLIFQICKKENPQSPGPGDNLVYSWL